MTVTTSSTASCAPASHSRSRQNIFNYSIFALCASLYLMPFMRLLFWGTDEGFLVYGAVRVAQGQVFARDFFEIIGPGSFYWLAIFFKLFGVTFVAERLCLFITSLLTGLLIYFLARQLCIRHYLLPCILLAGTYFGALWPAISHHVDSNCFALLSVACMMAWQKKQDTYRLFVGGVVIGTTTLFHQPKGALLLCACIVWLWVQNRRRAASLSSIGILAGGYIGAVALVAVYFGAHHALWDVFNANVLWPSRHYGAVNVVPYAQGLIDYYWNGWTGSHSGSKWLIMLATILILPFIFIATLPIVLVIVATWQRKHFSKSEVLLYSLCGLALWIAEIHRKDMVHLVFGSPLLIILCIYYIENLRPQIAELSLQFLSISATVLFIFNLALSLMAHPMATRIGSVAVFKNNSVITVIDERTAPGDEIFVYPSDPMVYFLTNTHNPIRYSGLMYNYNSPSEFEDVVRTLERHRVKYAVWDTKYQNMALKVFFPSAKPPSQDELIVEHYLESHYKIVWTGDGVFIMERMSD